ncbi:MAG: MOSC domain-containing protein [Bacteroidota bacterium]
MSWTGRLVSIYTTPRAGDLVRASQTSVVTADGLAGDRYARGIGSFSRWPASYRAVTLISQEALDAAEAEFGVSMQAGEHRRNLVVAGVPLADLRGVRFSLGADVVLEGARVCAPCKALIRRTGQPEAFNALVDRGGLRASVITPGTIHVGDAIGLVGKATPARGLPG